jgi:hypothetical protein
MTITLPGPPFPVAKAHRSAGRGRILTPPHVPVAVCVPVRDERALLPRLLEALDR